MSGDELRAGERLLRLEDLIKDEHLQEIPSWWAGLPIIGRARGRWVFVEPKGLDYPRQRVRRELLDVPSLDDLDIPDDEQNLERHNKTSWRPIKGENLHNWKSFALKSTNQVFQKVPDPDPYFNGIGVWLKMFRKSHGGLLRSGAMELIMAWQAGTTDRQRSAVSELLWTFTDHLTSRRGKTTTVQHYGPKQGDKAHINLIDPFSSSLGGPSSAPSAHAVQRKFERQKREQEQKMKEIGEAAIAANKANQRDAGEKREMDTLQSKIPIKWATTSTAPIVSSNQAQMRTVQPADTMLAIEWGKPFMASCPPASAGMGRMLGKPEWHGDAKYPSLWGAASKTFTPLDKMARPWEAAGLELLRSTASKKLA